MPLVEHVQRAIDDLRTAYSADAITVQEDGGGGAFVRVDGLVPGNLYEQATTWIGFRLTSQHPYADIYPHYVRGDLSRKSKVPLGDGMSGGHAFMGQNAIQISRRSNRWNPAVDTAAIKLEKVLRWLTTRP